MNFLWVAIIAEWNRRKRGWTTGEERNIHISNKKKKNEERNIHGQWCWIRVACCFDEYSLIHIFKIEWETEKINKISFDFIFIRKSPWSIKYFSIGFGFWATKLFDIDNNFYKMNRSVDNPISKTENHTFCSLTVSEIKIHMIRLYGENKGRTQIVWVGKTFSLNSCWKAKKCVKIVIFIKLNENIIC